MYHYVVSANYNDRKAGGWLSRRVFAGVDTAQLSPTLFATNVIMASGNRGESGFGCSLVGYAESVSVEPRDVPESAVQLSFDPWLGFYLKQTVEEEANNRARKFVDRFESLYLTLDGHAHAVLAEYPTSTSDELQSFHNNLAAADEAQQEAIADPIAV